MNMVTQFNKGDLISFGAYLLSEKRRKRFEASTKQSEEEGFNIQPTEEQLKSVHHADFENWLDTKSERNLLKRMQGVCEESLDPESFENWEKIKKVLEKARLE